VVMMNLEICTPGMLTVETCNSLAFAGCLAQWVSGSLVKAKIKYGASVRSS
jgi:hypothetical protein